MPMIAVSRRHSSIVLPFAFTALLGLAGCAVKYDNTAGITPAPVQILWNTNGPAQVLQLSDPLAKPPIVGDDAPPPSPSNPTPVLPIPDPNNPLQTPTTYGNIQTTSPLNAAELNAFAVTPGTFVYTPGEGTFLTPGVQTLSVTFTPKDTTRYKVTTRTVKINVSDLASSTGQAAIVPESVQIVGGGYVNGVFFHPTQKNPSLLYVRTDVGGAYRWVPSPLATKGDTKVPPAFGPTCPGYLKSDTTKTAAKGNNGEYMQCGSWLPLLDFLGIANGGDQSVESLGLDPSDPQRLYLSTGMNATNDPKQQNHFYLSGDQGKTFTVVNAPFPINGLDYGRDAGERFAVDPHLGTTIFYGTRTAGLWKSVDRGLTWTSVTTFPVNAGKPAAGAGVVFVTFDPSSGSSGAATPVLYAGVSDYNYYALDGSNNGSPVYSPIYKSTDAGATWLAVPGQTTYKLNSAGGNPTNYNLTPIHGVVGPDGSLYVTYSSDEGPDQTHSGLLHSSITAPGASTPTIINPGIGAVYQYTPAVGDPKGAGTWADISPTSPTRISGDEGGYSGLTLDAERPGVIMVSSIDNYPNGDAIYRSLDYGKTWKIVEQSLAGSINDASYATWLEGTTQNLGVAAGAWPSALAIDPNDSAHAVFGNSRTLWDTQNLLAIDINQQPIFTVGAYGSAPSGVKQLFGGSSIEEAVVLGLSSPPTGALLLSAVQGMGTLVHTSLDASPASGSAVGPLFATGTSVDFAQNLALTVVRVGIGSNGVDGTAPYYADPNVTTNPTCTTLVHPTNCLQVQIPQLLATTTTQGGNNQQEWRGIDTLWDYSVTPNLQSVTSTTKLSVGGGTVAIASDASTIVWATIDFPPACTGDGGNSWTAAKNGIIGAQVISDRVTPGKYYMYDSMSGTLLMGVATVTPATFQCNLTFNTQTTLGASAPGQLTASFGGAGDIWLAVNASSNASANGLYHSIDSGKTLTKTAFTQAFAVGVGAPATSSGVSAYSKPAIYTAAIGASGYGFYRSIDNGANWVLVSNPLHLMGTVTQIVGDPRTFGRFYVGTAGRGIAYVDSQ